MAVSPASAVVTATIPNGTSQSQELDLGGYTLFTFHMPAAWTAAALTFLVSPVSGGTFQSLTDDTGTEVSLTVAASKAVGILSTKAGALAACRFVKLQSGTAGTPVNQGADRVISVLVAAE